MRLIENKETTVTAVADHTAAMAGAAVGSLLAIVLVVVAVLIVIFKT